MIFKIGEYNITFDMKQTIIVKTMGCQYTFLHYANGVIYI